MPISFLCPLTRPGSGQSPFACHPAFGKAWQLEQCQPVGSLALIRLQNQKPLHYMFGYFGFKGVLQKHGHSIMVAKCGVDFFNNHCAKNQNS